MPNLMIGFGIDQVQAEYVAEIKLRNINQEYILKRVAETARWKRRSTTWRILWQSPPASARSSSTSWRTCRRSTPSPGARRFLYDGRRGGAGGEDVPDYPVHAVLLPGGLFQEDHRPVLRMSGEQKFKEGDELPAGGGRNNVELLFFTDKQQVYKCAGSELADGKAPRWASTCPPSWAWTRARTSSGMVPAGRLQRLRAVLL